MPKVKKPVLYAPGALYGYCPRCGAPGETRERRPNGNDVCQNGHTYPSLRAKDKPRKRSRK